MSVILQCVVRVAFVRRETRAANALIYRAVLTWACFSVQTFLPIKLASIGESSKSDFTEAVPTMCLLAFSRTCFLLLMKTR